MRILSGLLVASALTGVAASGLPAHAAETAAPPATITVTGEGEVLAAPDLATVSLGVTAQGETAAEAMSGASAALAAVIGRLKGAGVEAKDIQTSNLSLNPNWVAPADGSSAAVIDGYVASNMVTVRVRALEGLGGVLDAVVADGANTLNGISFGLADPDPLMDEARKEAVAEAKARAELLVGAAGASLGRILSISESGGMAPPMPMYRMEAAMASDAAVPVEAGEVGMVAAVTITWEIAQ